MEEKSIQGITNWTQGIWNDLHCHPELSGEETRTTAKVVDILEELGAEVTTFDDMTGAVAWFKGRARGPVLGFRADMDALPLEELADVKNRSRNPGVMHACGHDANTAIALGLARCLRDSGLLEQISGGVKFIFQPSEERLGGARAMIKHGALENPGVERLLAGHMDPNFPVGEVGVFSRIGHAASDPFELKIRGKGAHGARPHMGINPITAGAAFVNQVDTLIPRHVPPVHSAVISVGRFHAGDAGNVIPETAVIRGSIRSHNEEVRSILHREIQRLAEGIGVQFNLRAELSIRTGAPMGINDEDACAALRQASEAVLGPDKVHALPFIMGSDDFYFYARECPAAMMRIGCAFGEEGKTFPLHSPYFAIHPHALSVGIRILFQAVKTFFG